MSSYSLISILNLFSFFVTSFSSFLLFLSLPSTLILRPLPSYSYFLLSSILIFLIFIFLFFGPSIYFHIFVSFFFTSSKFYLFAFSSFDYFSSSFFFLFNLFSYCSVIFTSSSFRIFPFDSSSNSCLAPPPTLPHTNASMSFFSAFFPEFHFIGPSVMTSCIRTDRQPVARISSTHWPLNTSQQAMQSAFQPQNQAITFAGV